MARRKVTMLEAFQRSARETAEREAAERRRIIAEREREIRRSETAKAAQELGQRLSQRASDGVESILESLRGVHEAAEKAAEEAAAGSSVASPAAPTADSATDIHLARPVPPLASFDSANRTEVTPVATVPRPTSAPPTTTADEPAADASLTASRPAPASAPSEEEQALAAETPAGEPSAAEASASGEDSNAEAPEEPFAGVSSEEVDEAIASLQDDEFALPMTAKAFALVAAGVLLAIFFIGFNLGRQSGGGDPAASNGAVLAGSGAMGLERPARRPATPLRNLPTPDRGAGTPSAAIEQAAPTSALTPSPAAGPIRPVTAADRGFLNPAMDYTILAITYSRTEAHVAMAYETYDFLLSEGFPVIQPVECGKRIFLFVGVSSSMSDLENLKAELQLLESGDGGPREFRRAYLVNLDDYR